MQITWILFMQSKEEVSITDIVTNWKEFCIGIEFQANSFEGVKLGPSNDYLTEVCKRV